MRFYNVFDQGMWSFDGAIYANSAISLYLIPKWIYLNYDNYDSFNLFFKEMANFIGDSGGSNYFSKHPAHIFLVFISYVLFGVNDYSIHIMNSLLGVFTIILLFYLVKRFFNIKIAIIACCLLAVSSNHLFISRTTGVQVGLVFFSIMSSYYFIESHKNPELKRKLWLSGLFLGFALMIHKSVGLLFITFLIIEWSYKINYRDFINRFSILSITGVSLFILYEVVLKIYSNFIGNLLNVEISARNSSGLIVLLGHLKTVLFEGFSGLNNIFSHTQGVYLKEGILCLSFFIIGVFLTIVWIKNHHMEKKHRFDNLKYSFILVGFLLPFIFWSLFSGKTGTTKGFQYALPYFFIVSAIGFDFLSERYIKSAIHQNLLLNVFICVTLAIGINRNLDFIVLTNGYKEATKKTIEYAKANGGVISIKSPNIDYNPIISFYLSCEYQMGDKQIKEHILFRKEDAKNINSDYMFFYWDYIRKQKEHNDQLKIIKNCEPVLTIENSMGKIPSRFWTNRNKSRLKRLKKAHSDPRIDKIYVYDLRECG